MTAKTRPASATTGATAQMGPPGAGNGKRILWLDATRVVAIFCVVLLHTAALRVNDYGRISLTDWHIANLLDALSRPAVPLFFMASGALLLGRPIGFDALRQRLPRLIIPLAAWSMVYLIIRYLGEPDLNLIKRIAGALLYPVMYHLWFMYAIIGIYLCLPLVAPAVQAATPAQLFYGLVLWVVASGVIPTLEAVGGFKSDVELSTMTGYIGYAVLGYVLANIREPGRKHAVIALIMAVTGLSITVAGTAIVTLRGDSFFHGFYDYLTPNIMLYSAGSFLLLRLVFQTYDSRAIRILADLSFGIYLSHLAVLMLAARLFNFGSQWIIPVALLVFGVSAGLTYALRRLGLAKIFAP